MPMVLLKIKFKKKKNVTKTILDKIKCDVQNIVKNKTFDNIYISYKVQ